MLAAVALLVFASGLWRVIRAAGHEAAAGWNLVGLLGAVTLTTTILSVSAVQLALPLTADTAQTDDTVQRTNRAKAERGGCSGLRARTAGSRHGFGRPRGASVLAVLVNSCGWTPEGEDTNQPRSTPSKAEQRHTASRTFPPPCYLTQ